MAERHDHELSVRAIVVFSVGLAVVIAGAFALMWIMTEGFERDARREEIREPALPDLAVRPEMTAPRLQSHPELEWQEMKAEEASELASYRLLDPESGRVQIPIEEAMRRLLDDGLPTWPAEAP